MEQESEFKRFCNFREWYEKIHRLEDVRTLLIARRPKVYIRTRSIF